MKARIHRGASEVGGSCVELEAGGGERLLLDLGLPLNADIADAAELLPAVAGLVEGDDPGFLGIVLSHAHPDHFGLIENAAPSIPVYMGAATEKTLREASFFTPLGLDREVAGHLHDRQRVQIGPFAVTPHLVDHSAFDSYAFCVEADGRRLFYSGDLRSHGRKGGTFDRLVDRPPGQVDVLLLEGTTVGRPATTARIRSEVDVENAARDVIASAPGLVLACFSGQNVDRLVSIYRAAASSGRDLIVDLYAAAIADATGKETIPHGSWTGVRVFVPNSQRIQVKDSGQFWRVNELGGSRIYAEEIAEDPTRFVMTFRTSMARELERAGCLDGATAIWSMWPGYLDGEAGDKTRRIFDRADIPLTVIHASGHASVEDLQRLAGAIAADRVVPIHTDAPDRFPELFDRVDIKADGKWWEV